MTSIELPEAKILAEQMHEELRGKQVQSYQLQDIARLQRSGLMAKDTSSFDRLVDGKVESVVSRGNVIRVQFDNGMNLILGLEYGGKIFYHPRGEAVPDKFHLKVAFGDDTALTVRLTSMGHIDAARDDGLERSYAYRREFNPRVASPIDGEFSLDLFSQLLAGNNRMLKSALVGKDAIVVGLSNSAFQDMSYRAKLHPKRKAAELNAAERHALFEALDLVLRERIRLKGKAGFYDLYGNEGGYRPAMGPHMTLQVCPSCATPIEKLSVGGGQVYLCPTCQT